ncbi:MAG: hypothetical protein IOB85_10330 [Methylobacterium sp.]|nr:hypothetical protein [Rhodobacter sp.]MCA3655087.1 hypothetical protein [Methylobacterium sp.]MCA3659268.1 hypothetical protein [Methylobacterium sp.]MCA3661821.1 hypothetical protein [Methylobacterium sp.]MCA3664680.1 hypothetical protein [Methylobacterium sp.]
MKGDDGFCRLGRLQQRLALGPAAQAAFAAHDSLLDHDIVGATDQQQMLDIVAPDDDELSPLAVEREGIRHGQPLHPAAPRRVARKVQGGPQGANQPKRNRDHDDQKYQPKPDPEHRGDGAVAGVQLVEKRLHGSTTGSDTRTHQTYRKSSIIL